MQYLTKELMTVILDTDVINVLGIDGNNIDYTCLLNQEIGYRDVSINIHELAHKCKEFLKENWLCVWSGNGFNKSIGYECSVTHFMYGDIKTFKANTEAEAIFAATEALIKGEIDFD